MSFFHKKKASTKTNAANVHMTEAEAALAQSDFNIDKILDIQNKFTGGTALLVPGRIFIREGMLWKVCRKGPKKRQFFLFNDILVYGSVVAGRYSNQHILPLAHMVVSGDPSYQPETNTTFNIDTLDEQLDIHNAFQISHADKSFHVFSLSQADKANWLANLQKHINKVALVGGNQTMAPRAVWVPDSQSKECMICGLKFTAFNRKHHCRQCGRVVCSTCSPHRVIIDPQTEGKPERACSECVKDVTPVKSKGSPELNTKSTPAAAAAQVVSNVMRSQGNNNHESPRKQTEESPRQRRDSTDTETEDSDDSEREQDTPPSKKKPTPTPRRSQSESAKHRVSKDPSSSSPGPPQRPPPFGGSSLRRPPPPSPHPDPQTASSSSPPANKDLPKPKPRTRKPDQTPSTPPEAAAKEEGGGGGRGGGGGGGERVTSDEPQPTPPPRKRKKAKLKQQMEQQLQRQLQERAVSEAATTIPPAAETVGDMREGKEGEREGEDEKETETHGEEAEEEDVEVAKIEEDGSEAWEAGKEDGVQIVEAVNQEEVGEIVAVVGEVGGEIGEAEIAELVTEPVEEEEEREGEGEEVEEAGREGKGGESGSKLPQRRREHFREQDDEEGANVEDSSHQQEEATPTDSTHLQEEAPPTDSTHNQEATPTDSAPSQQDEQLADQDPNSALEAEAAGSGQENEHQSGQESGHSSLPLETTEEGVPMKKPRGRRQKFKQPES